MIQQCVEKLCVHAFLRSLLQTFSRLFFVMMNVLIYATYGRLKQICFGEPCTDNFRIHCLFTYLLKRYGQRLFAISASLIHTNERIYPSRRSLVTQNSVFPYQFPTETKKWSANYSVLISLSVHKKKKRWWSTNFSVL